MDVDYAILGGGVAGLAAAIRLTELGMQPLIIEAGNYPSQKVCGEFFSPSCLPLLKQWGIDPVLIPSTKIHAATQTIDFNFPHPAGSLSHLTLDPLLADYAVKQGATLLTQTKVDDLKPASHGAGNHRLMLNSGQTIKVKKLLIATGRLPSLSFFPPSIKYIGFKTHWSGLSFEPRLDMFAFPGAYLGLSPVEEGKYNIACLASVKRVCDYSSPELFINDLIQKHPVLSQRLAEGTNMLGGWMQASIPHFGLKKVPAWPATYFIGDAISPIPPACGGGLAFALASGYLAATFASQNNSAGYLKAWRRYSARPLFFGKILHHLFLNQHLSRWGFRLGQQWPQLPSYLYQLTRDCGMKL